MKYIISIILSIIICYSQTNEAKYLKKGDVITIPYNGWFFNIDSTKRLIEAELLKPKLQLQITNYQLKIDALNDINKNYKDVYNTFIKDNIIKKDKPIENSIYFFSGFILGTASVIGLLYVIK